MDEYCTCGARLPEDARFCHRCGKPQRDEPEIEALSHTNAPVEQTVAPETTPVAGPPPVPSISFRNPMAVRAAMIACALATVAGLLPLPGLFHSLWQLVTVVAGGFASVYFYQRRTGDYLSVRGGLQIGWMTGLFCFVVTMVLLTLLLAVLAGVGETGLRQLAAESGNPEIVQAFQSIISNPAMLIFALAAAFFVMTMLASLGGALGSKVLDRE